MAKLTTIQLYCDFLALCIAIFQPTGVFSLTEADLYPFGVGNGDTRLVGSTAFVPFSFNVSNFRGFSFVSDGYNIFDNGRLSLASGTVTASVLVSPLANNDPFTVRGDIFHRLTNDSDLLNRARDDIRRSSVAQIFFNPTYLIIATWVNHTRLNTLDPVAGNTFQVIFVTDRLTTYAIILFVEVNDIPSIFNTAVAFVTESTTTTIAELPYANNLQQAPNLSLGTSIPGTYIVKLSDTICPTRDSPVCQLTLAAIACEKLMLSNYSPLPTICDSFP